MSKALQQFYEMIARRFSEIEQAKLERADKVCEAWEAYQRGEITAAECDRRIAEIAGKKQVTG